MLVYEQDSSAQKTTARFGSLVNGGPQKYAMPATAPTPRLRYEARAVLKLEKAGAEIPCLIVPLSTRREIVAELTPILPRQYGQTSLAPDNSGEVRPIVIPDLETEAFTLAGDARARFQAETRNRPHAVSELLKCGLTSESKIGKERRETGDAWEFVDREYRLTSLGPWLESMEEQARASVFLAPTPLIRVRPGSAARAFDYGWEIADVVHSDAFQGRGLQLLVHAEMFLDTPEAESERHALQEQLRSLHTSPNPRNYPYIAIKILDQVNYLSRGSRVLVALGHLKEFLCEAAEHVTAAKGVLILLNAGTLCLAALDCGVDITGFRGTGDTFTIDAHFGFPARSRTGGGGKPVVSGMPKSPSKRLPPVIR